MGINAKDYLVRLRGWRHETIRTETDESGAEVLSLAELRGALGRSPAELAERIGVPPVAIPAIERRMDKEVGTLRRVIEAMGGSLVILARFPYRPPVHIRLSGAPGDQAGGDLPTATPGEAGAHG